MSCIYYLHRPALNRERLEQEQMRVSVCSSYLDAHGSRLGHRYEYRAADIPRGVVFVGFREAVETNQRQ